MKFGGACDANMVDGELSEQENADNPCKDIGESSTTSNSTNKKALFCASDGRTYYSTRAYACAVRLHSDWYHCKSAYINQLMFRTEKLH